MVGFLLITLSASPVVLGKVLGGSKVEENQCPSADGRKPNRKWHFHSCVNAIYERPLSRIDWALQISLFYFLAIAFFGLECVRNDVF
jgi:hypothetical protein